MFSLPIFLFFLVSVFLYLYYFSTSVKLKRQGSVAFRHYPFVGSVPGYLQNRHRFLDWTTDFLQHCPTATATFYRPARTHGVITANPANVEHVLKNNFHNYPKGEQFVDILQDFLGGGIFNSDADSWRLQRKTASYEFNTKSLRNFLMDSVRSETLSRLVPTLTNASLNGCVLDLQDFLQRYAFDNICKVAFNFDPGCLGDDGTAGAEFMRAFDDATELNMGRFFYVFQPLWKIKKFLNVGSERKLKNSIAVVHELAENIINSRMDEEKETMEEDLLSRFFGYRESSPEFLRDIVISFILAGRDTTSSALTWFFWLLASHPNVEQNILNELESIRARNGKTIGETYSFDELRDMHYLHAAISETLRLYPPVPTDTKSCSTDDTLPDGTFIGKGWFVTYHAYAMGRMKSVWGENCREYIPERWLENGIYRAENAFRFPVFNGGPRICLGKDMAYIQMKSVAASVIEKFVMDVQDKDTFPEKVLSLTLRMKNELRVRVKKRGE